MGAKANECVAMLLQQAGRKELEFECCCTEAMKLILGLPRMNDENLFWTLWWGR